MTRKRIRPLLICALVALLASCSYIRQTFAPARPAPPPAAGATAFDYGACMAELTQLGVQYQKMKDFHTPQGCGIDGAIRVNRSAIPWNQQLELSCPLEAAIWKLETQVVEPDARRLLGHSVTRMINEGSYACRGEIGDRPDRLSQHAFGRAIDISGFDFDDGTRITFLRDWRDSGPKGTFLRTVAKDACNIFQVVLTPNTNSSHRDHMHVDIGPYKDCSV